MLENQYLQADYKGEEKSQRSYIKTILIRFLCFALCFILIWLGYGVYKSYVEKINYIEGIELVVPLSQEFDYKAQEVYILNKSLEKRGLRVVTKQEKAKTEIYSYYETYMGVEDKKGKVLIQPKYDYLRINEDGNYIMATYCNPKNDPYSDIKDIIHYYNFDGSDYVKGNYCEGEDFQDGYAVVSVPWEEAPNIYFKKKSLVINDKGKVVYESPYSNVSNVPGLKGFFVVYNELLSNGFGLIADDKKGIINSEGEILVPIEYYSIDCNKEQQIIYLTKLDENGNEILYCMDYNFNSIPVDETWEFRANHSFEYINSMENGIVYNPNETMNKEDIFKNARTVKEDENGWHIVDGNNQIIADFPDCVKMYDFSECVSVVEYKDKIKYVDTSGRVLFETKKIEGYDLEEEYGGNRFLDGTIEFAEYSGNRFLDGTIEFAEYRSSFLGNDYKIGLLDKTGKVILPAEFDSIIRIVNDGKNKQAIVRKNGKYGVVNLTK